MSYELVIKNGTRGRRHGRASATRPMSAIADGKVAEIGKVTEGAKRTIDADGLVVAPGFVDPHTHYDAQICWDGAVTPSSWHGVTSVVMGNCGVGIAPCKPETREIAMQRSGQRRGHPVRRAEQGHHLGLGDLPPVHGRRGGAQAVAQPRLHRAAHAVPPLRDGRGLDGARGDRRGNRARSPS